MFGARSQLIAATGFIRHLFNILAYFSGINDCFTVVAVT